MLHALTSALFRRRRDMSQLALEFDAQPRDAEELLARLRSLGLKRIGQCTLTSNRNVMVSYRGSELRVHEGYLTAPRDVHQAIVTFIEGRTRGERRSAQRRIVSFEIQVPRAPARRERSRPEDAPIVTKLAEWHACYNAEHFDGTLATIPVRVSRRMKSRLGHYTAAAEGRPGEIAISWRHLRRHGWQEVLDTLLHEMVHQWQDETRQPIDHGRVFREKARAVGITASARRAPRS
jgi:SprT-like family protein